MDCGRSIDRKYRQLFSKSRPYRQKSIKKIRISLKNLEKKNSSNNRDSFREFRQTIANQMHFSSNDRRKK